MLELTRQSGITAALVLSLSLAFSLPAFSAPISSNASIESSSAAQLHRGDLVQLRSGGPLMTVAGSKGDQVDCFWTDWNGQPNDATFPLGVLQKF